MKDRIGNGITTDAYQHLVMNAANETVRYTQANNETMSEVTTWYFRDEESLLKTWFLVNHAMNGKNLSVVDRTITLRRQVSMSYYYEQVVKTSEFDCIICEKSCEEDSYIVPTVGLVCDVCMTLEHHALWNCDNFAHNPDSYNGVAPCTRNGLQCEHFTAGDDE